MGKRRIGLLDSLLSLGAFAQQGYAWLVGPAIAVGGPLYLLWGSVVVAAAAHGWWVYPFVVVVAIAAVFGLWMLVLHLNSRIRLLLSKDARIDEERQVVRRIAEQAMNLAAELNELLGEHQSRPPTIYRQDVDPDAWQRDNWNISRALTQKFLTKYATKAHSILMMAARYGVIFERDIEWTFRSLHSSSIEDIRNQLVRVASQLQDRLQIPVDQVLPYIPTFDAQKRLPLDGDT